MGDQFRIEGRTVLFDVGASAALISEVDRGAVRSLAAGRRVEEAEQELTDNLSLGAPPQIVVQPDWIKRWSWLDRVPYLRARIQVVVLR
jgi:hypothetical protein